MNRSRLMRRQGLSDNEVPTLFCSIFMTTNYKLFPAQLKQKIYYAPAPTGSGTACLLAGVAIAYFLYPQQAEVGISSMARAAAIPVGIGFLVGILFDLRQGLRNLFRTDLLCLAGIYALTLAEFLFPQEGFNTWDLTTEEIALSLNIILLGIATFTIGRHLVKPVSMKSKWLTLSDLSSNAMFQIIIIGGFLGFLYMLLSVNFDIFEMIDAMMGARFTQPWGRGSLGGWNSLLTELSLMMYIVPPLCGVILNRRHKFSFFQLLLIFSIFSLVLFHSFAGGTRNVFISHISTFLMGYLITLPRNTIYNTIIPIILVVLIAGYGSHHMLAFRTIGLRNYVENKVYAIEKAQETLAVDYNLGSIATVASNMPKNYNFLGLEILTWSIVKPVPRALWPGKPEGLSVSIEEIAGAKGFTLAVTYLGEAYMMAGMFGVAAISLFFGALAAWWNRMAISPQSDYGLVVYALGFFAAGITMRSMMWLTTAILPVIAMIVVQKMGLIR